MGYLKTFIILIVTLTIHSMPIARHSLRKEKTIQFCYSTCSSKLQQCLSAEMKHWQGMIICFQASHICRQLCSLDRQASYY